MAHALGRVVYGISIRTKGVGKTSTMIIPTCKASYVIESYMVDFRDKLKLSMLLGLQQETAFQHAAKLFSQYGDPSADGAFWVVTQSWTTVARFPTVKEHIEVETWIRKFSRVTSRRIFRVTDSQGRLVALTSMDWAVLDLESRTPRRLDTWNIDPRLLVDVPGSTIEGQRLRQIPELAPSYLKTVRYSDIDVNNHANNTRYADWILDCFDLDYLSQKEIAQIHLGFRQECSIGEQINIYKGTYADDSYYVEGQFSDASSDTLKGRQAFQAKLDFI